MNSLESTAGSWRSHSVQPSCRRDSPDGFFATGLPPRTPANSCNRSPIFQPVGLGHRSKVSLGLPSLSKCLLKPPFASGKIDEVDQLACLGVRPPIFAHRRIALQRQSFANRVPLARIVNQERKRPRVNRQPRLVGGHVIGHAMFRLARGVTANHRRPVELQRIEHAAIKMIHVAQVVCATNVRGCIMAICAISLRRSCLPAIALPCTLIFVFWPV